MREKEEELSGKATIIQTVFSIELDHETLLQVGSGLARNLGEGVLENVRSADFDVALSRKDAHGRLGPEVNELASEVALVLGHILVERRWQAGIIPRRRLGVVVDKVNTCSVSKAHFPTAGERTQLGDWLLLNSAVSIVLPAVHPDVLLSPWIDPGRGPGVVVDKVRPSFGGKSLLPARREFARAGARRTGVHHSLSVRALGGLLRLEGG